MKKIVLILFLLCSKLYGVSGFAYWWNVNVSKDTVTATKLKNNYDSIKNWASRVSDTINRTVVHFNPSALNKTNTVQYVQVDTIRSNPNIDSISGTPYINALTTPSAGITYENVDSSHNRVITADSATISVMKGHTTKRDSTTFTGGAYFAGIGRFAGTLIAPVVDIDSMGGDVEIGGRLNVGQRDIGVRFGVEDTAASTAAVKYIGTLRRYVTNFTSGQNGDGSAIAFQTTDRDNNNFTTGYIGSYWSNILTGVRRGGICFGLLNESDSLNPGIKAYINYDGSFNTVGSITTTTINTGSIQFSNGDLLSVYDTGSFACSTYVGDLTVQKYGRIRYCVVGELVTIRINGDLNGTSSSGDFRISIGDMPSGVKPDSVVTGAGSVFRDNSTDYGSVWFLNPASSYIEIQKQDLSSITPSNSKGINISYGKGYIITYNRH